MLQILMVDDDPGQLRTREMILRRAGFVVHIATNVDSALAVLRTMGDKIGVVLSDHHLPGRNGVDLVRELRTTSPDMRVVILSGMPGVESEYEGLNVDVRVKPFPPDELIQLVQSSVEK